MSNEENSRIESLRSSEPTVTGTPQMETKVTLDLATLASRWSSLPQEVQRQLWRSVPEVSPIIDSLIWMQDGWTKTRDDQDPSQAYKPFPMYPYFEVLHKLWQREPILFIEKSRTMMCSWWAAAETLHWIMTRQPSKAIFWAQDEDRSLTLLNYAWCLYEHQDWRLKGIFPLDRPKDRQRYNNLELKDGGLLLALPGKDPEKIRGEHPTIVIMDEAAFIENWGEAFDVAIASKVPRVMCISSAAPGAFRNVTKHALPEELPI